MSPKGVSFQPRRHPDPGSNKDPSEILYPLPLRARGIQILPPAHSFWRITPIGGLPPEYTSYECAGPNLTKIQFQVPPRSRGDHFQNSSRRVEPLFPSASQGEWSRMVPRPIEVAFLTSATPIWGMGVVSPFTYIYTYNNSI